MKTAEQVLNEVADENMLSVEIAITIKQLVLEAMRRYALLYYHSKIAYGVQNPVANTLTNRCTTCSGLTVVRGADGEFRPCTNCKY